jgi:hypothetical protein
MNLQMFVHNFHELFLTIGSMIRGTAEPGQWKPAGRGQLSFIVCDHLLKKYYLGARSICSNPQGDLEGHWKKSSNAAGDPSDFTRALLNWLTIYWGTTFEGLVESPWRTGYLGSWMILDADLAWGKWQLGIHNINHTGTAIPKHGPAMRIGDPNWGTIPTSLAV